MSLNNKLRLKCVSGTLRAEKQNREPNEQTETEAAVFFIEPKPNRDTQY